MLEKKKKMFMADKLKDSSVHNSLHNLGVNIYGIIH